MWVGRIVGDNEITVGAEQKVSGQTDIFMQGVTASTPNSLSSWYSPKWFYFMHGI